MDVFREMIVQSLAQAEQQLRRFAEGTLKMSVDSGQGLQDITVQETAIARAHVKHMQQMLTDYDATYSKKPLP